ncbi:MAG: hypothetical protein AAFR92_04265 [Pseudomonadota bacterium]
MLRYIASFSFVLFTAGCTADKASDPTPIKILGTYSTDDDVKCETNVIDLTEDSVTIYADGQEIVRVETEYKQPFETAQGGVWTWTSPVLMDNF